MKVIAVLLFIVVITIMLISGQAQDNNLNQSAEIAVLAYQQDLSEINIQMKPISRGTTLSREVQETSIKLMSFNMHRGIGRNGKLNLGNTAVVINESNADIIALQEVERFSIRTGFKDQIKHLSEELGMNYAFGKSINLLNGEYGNGLLSRYPIIEYMTYDLPSYSEQRTLLRTLVDVEGNQMAVYNTHLGLKQAERMEQLEYILQLISEERFDYVLMGDMNTKITKLTALTKTLVDSAEGSDYENQSTFVEKDISERIDYIFASENLKPVHYEVIQTEASDHYPVICEIKVGK